MGPMPNIRGKAYGINVITPVKNWKTKILNILFKILTLKVLQKDLHSLSFIHFARWTVIPNKAFPHFPQQTAQENLKYDYMMFESNFNGSWNEYIDAFNSVLSLKLNLIWYWSENYPGSQPLTPFKDYITHNQIYTDYYYMAYPGSTVNDVKNALTVTRNFEKLVSSLEKPDKDFEKAFNSFFIKTQNQLGATGSLGPEMT
ncbi:MAG: hypothetical protein ACJA0I_001110 [Gammaproteobacteria bacterium]|jgi:hypothetical protein